MGQAHTKKETNKVLTCQDLLNVFYVDKNSLIEQQYVQIISQTNINPYQIELLLRTKNALIDQWNILFKKKQKLISTFPMNQLLNQFVPSTILNLNEEYLNQYHSLFLIYLSDDTLPIIEENLIKIASSIYKINQSQTKKQLDSLQNDEEMTYLKNLRQQIPQEPLFKTHWTKTIRIVNLLKLILENNCQLIYAFINTIKDNSAQSYFYSFFWEQYVQTMVPLRIFSQCLLDFSNILDAKYEYDLPKLRIEIMGAKLWSQTFQPWIQMNVNLLGKQIYIIRDSQKSIDYLPNFVKALFDLMYSEKTLKWIGHSQVQHNTNIIAFKILLIENTKSIQQKWSQIDLENVPQKITDDISIMKKIIPAWLLDLTVTTIHLQYLRSRLSGQLILLPQETINSIMNSKLKQFQKQFDLIQDPSENYTVVRQSNFDIYEILCDLSYFKSYIEKSEFSTAKTQGSNFQFSKFQSVLSSGLSDQCISFQQQQYQQQQQQQQQQYQQQQQQQQQRQEQQQKEDDRKYSYESFTEEIQSNDQNLKQQKNSQQILSEVIDFYVRLMIDTQIDIQDRNKRVSQKNLEAEVLINQAQIQFMDFFPQFRLDTHPQMHLYKEQPQDQNCLSENINKSVHKMLQ